MPEEKKNLENKAASTPEVGVNSMFKSQGIPTVDAVSTILPPIQPKHEIFKFDPIKEEDENHIKNQEEKVIENQHEEKKIEKQHEEYANEHQHEEKVIEHKQEEKEKIPIGAENIDISRQEEPKENEPLVYDAAFIHVPQNNRKDHVGESVSEYKTKQMVMKDTGRSDCNQFLFDFYRYRSEFKKTLTRSIFQ